MFFIQQTNDHDCGFTCLKILLANIHHDRNYLFMKDTSKEDNSFYSFIKEASNYQTELVALKALNKEEITSYKQFPIIARIEVEGTGCPAEGTLYQLWISRKKRGSLAILQVDASGFVLDFENASEFHAGNARDDPDKVAKTDGTEHDFFNSSLDCICSPASGMAPGTFGQV